MTDTGCPPPWRALRTSQLAALLTELHYKPEYTFTLWTHNKEVVLAIDHDTNDSHTQQPTRIGHRFTVPPTILNTDRPTTRRWLLNRIQDIDTHEACEWFRENDIRPFDPHHHPQQHAYQTHDWTQGNPP